MPRTASWLNKSDVSYFLPSNITFLQYLTDNERTKLKKKKLLKSFKSKQRFQKMDLEQKKKADNWKSFISAKGTKKKAGFMIGRRKKSMFSVGEGSKVGIVNKPQGHGMTSYSAKKKHEFE